MSMDELLTVILPSFLPILLPKVDCSSDKCDNQSLRHMAQRKENIATSQIQTKNRDPIWSLTCTIQTDVLKSTVRVINPIQLQAINEKSIIDRQTIGNISMIRGKYIKALTLFECTTILISTVVSSRRKRRLLEISNILQHDMNMHE